jgi:hypothetical protein
MKVFISWSGDRSKAVAEALHDWLPVVLQRVRPYFTPSDIEKGARWSNEIARELDESEVGIICLTRESLGSEWILFEAGALSKKLTSSRVCPILFGIENPDVKGPLTQFQATRFDKRDIRNLIGTINALLGDDKLAETVLNSVFDKWWPDLQGSVDRIMSADPTPVPAPRSDRELLEELLALTRGNRLQLGGTSKPLARRLESCLIHFLDDFACVFDADWEYARDIVSGGMRECFILDGQTFLRPGVDDENSNWKSRGALLASYRDLQDVLADMGYRIGPGLRYTKDT